MEVMRYVHTYAYPLSFVCMHIHVFVHVVGDFCCVYIVHVQYK